MACYRLRNPVKHYAWGSRTAIADVHVAGTAVIAGGEVAPGRVPANRILADFRRAMARLWGAG